MATKKKPTAVVETTKEPEAGKEDEKGTTIKIPALNITKMHVRLLGTSSLITNAWSEKAKKQMRDKQTKQGTMARAAKDPKADFEAAKYRDTKGREAVPALAFKNAIVSAARFADDMKMTVLRGALFVEGDLLPIEHTKCVMREDMVRLKSGSADLRYRPEYHDWKVNIAIAFNANVLSAEQILNLVRLAGFSVGVCEWRPEKNGQHGRFEVDLNA